MKCRVLCYKLHMTKHHDLTGNRYGRLVAVEHKGYRRGATYWLFACDCGNRKEIAAPGVKSGAVRSCGCLHFERCSSGLNQLKHGDAKKGAVTRLHSIWRGMLKRAGNGYQSADTRYRDRGIGVCEEWSTYPPFKAWSELNGYADGLTIDRINNDDSYSPENCRWTTKKEQARNRRSSRILTANGKSQTIAAWSEESGLGASTIHTRLRRGWTLEKALLKPPMHGVTGRPRKNLESHPK